MNNETSNAGPLERPVGRRTGKEWLWLLILSFALWSWLSNFRLKLRYGFNVNRYEFCNKYLHIILFNKGTRLAIKVFNLLIIDIKLPVQLGSYHYRKLNNISWWLGNPRLRLYWASRIDKDEERKVKS